MKLKRTKADKLFSDFIRLRDNYQCQKCHIRIPPPTKDIHSRCKKSVRFDPENAIAACRRCHLYFDGYSSWGIERHRKEFEELMLVRLGQEKYDLLAFRANKPEKVDETLIVMWLQEELKKYDKKNNKC